MQQVTGDQGQWRRRWRGRWSRRGYCSWAMDHARLHLQHRLLYKPICHRRDAERPRASSRRYSGNSLTLMPSIPRPHIRFLFVGSHLCSTLLSDTLSRDRCPCVSLRLHLHQVGEGTSTPELSNMPSTQKEPPVGGSVSACTSGCYCGLGRVHLLLFEEAEDLDVAKPLELGQPACLGALLQDSPDRFVVDVALWCR